MNKIIKLKPLTNYKIWIKFSDNIKGEVDLSHLAGRGVFLKWDDYQFFKSVKIGNSGDLFWCEK